jgi:hypothetical protein
MIPTDRCWIDGAKHSPTTGPCPLCGEQPSEVLPENWQIKLFNAVSEYDRRQSRSKSYNPYALAHYARSLGYVRRYVQQGETLRDSILNCFLGRLADKLLKSAGLPLMTNDEAKFGPSNKLPELPEEN